MEEGSRAEELRALGWSAEDVRSYEELWEYRQRWGAINLEREERIFLRKAEAALPRRTASGRGSTKKSTREKAHYRWLAFHLEAMRASALEQGLAEGEAGAWPIILEEELAALDQYEPVLGLPDTLKAREFLPARERWASEAAALGRTESYDFAAPLEALRQQGPTSWKPLRGEAKAGATDYPVLAAEDAGAFRARIRQEMAEFTRSTYPSLKQADEPAQA